MVRGGKGLQGLFVLGNERSRERKFQGTNSLENEGSRERTVQGTNVPGNEYSTSLYLRSVLFFWTHGVVAEI